MKQIFANFLLPVLIIVIFLAKSADGGNSGPTPPPDTGFDRVRMTADSTGTAMLVSKTLTINK